MLSHELGPPAAIQGSIALLQRKYRDPHSCWAETFGEANRHLTRLIDDLRDVSPHTRGS